MKKVGADLLKAKRHKAATKLKKEIIVQVVLALANPCMAPILTEMAPTHSYDP